jgi:outer membrane protein W
VRCGVPVLKEKENAMRIARFFLAASLAVVISAAPAHAGKTSFGIKAGISTTNAYNVAEGWDDAIDWKTGLTGGVLINYAFNECFSLQPELLYTQKGFGRALLEDIIDLTVSLDYFELPVLAKYTFSPGKKFRPALFAGPSFAYCSSSTLTVSALILSADIDFSSLTHVTDFGLILGGGFDYSLENGTIVFDARFEWGMTNVIMSGDFEINGDTHTIDEDDFKNYGLSITLGYIF